jgi:hypothetical protein
MILRSIGLSRLLLNILIAFYLSLSAAVNAADEKILGNGGANRRGYTKGEMVPVSCLNRTMYAQPLFLTGPWNY